jgi:hypothetical protein
MGEVPVGAKNLDECKSLPLRGADGCGGQTPTGSVSAPTAFDFLFIIP